jgi:glycosyltransferase involved in cell wall biosynthesis
MYSRLIPISQQLESGQTQLSHANFRKWLDKHDIKLIMDLDDRWYLDYHVDPKNAEYYNNISQKFIIESLKIADVIWVASKYLMKKLRKELSIDKDKLFYIPNGLEPVMDGWQPTEHPDVGEPVFGYVAALGHQRDVGILKDLFVGKKCLSIEYDKWMVDGEQFQYKDVLGSDYIVEKPKDFQNYSEFYDKINVSLAPLQETDFTNCKSYLKAVEAGFKKRALIASNTKLYREIIEDGKNGILCRTRSEWEHAINTMTVERAKELGEALYETVIEKYNINKINEDRIASIESVL